MDEALVKQLTKQLRMLNLWIRIFGILLLASLLIIGFLVYKVVVFTQEAGNKIDNLQDKVTRNVDFKQKACSNERVESILGGTCN